MIFAINAENLKLSYKKTKKKTKISYIFKKILSLSIVYIKCGYDYEKLFKEEWIEILKSLSLINNIEEYQKI